MGLRSDLLFLLLGPRVSARGLPGDVVRSHRACGCNRGDSSLEPPHGLLDEVPREHELLQEPQRRPIGGPGLVRQHRRGDPQGLQRRPGGRARRSRAVLPRVQLQRLADLGHQAVHLARAAQRHRLLQQEEAALLLLFLPLRFLAGFLFLFPPARHGPPPRHRDFCGRRWRLWGPRRSRVRC
ncbi:LOW QUALITY PROTEIN: hypothetical protein QTO34_005968 [Cnephaeus nilssonii]|uniref:Secreted protein n=1 Tax=Cnephaeus nilssonii TaxID=3371016 RepID=A0AA40LJ65_CNENI|nr:LOW QUALITY PROTEIN: hypothetical protein QTO34_005968 [Eptesicus nilssonii]